MLSIHACVLQGCKPPRTVPTCVGTPITVQLPRLIIALLHHECLPQNDVRARIPSIHRQGSPHSILALLEQPPLLFTVYCHGCLDAALAAPPLRAGGCNRRG